MDIQRIKELALANGFSLKPQVSGNMDLNAYVYDFANAVEREVKAQSDQKIKLLLCDEHLKKCESPTGIFNSQYPDEEPCLICLAKEAKAQAMPDLSELQERIAGHQYYHDEHGHMIVDMDDVVKEISGFDSWKAQAVPEWISVQDRMPEQGQKVLVFRPDAHNHPHKDPNFKICTYAGADIFINSHFEHVITHWKPLESPIEAQEPAND